MYKTTLQFAIDHIYETNSERIVGLQIKCKTYEPLFVFGVYLPADSSIDNSREEWMLLTICVHIIVIMKKL